MSEAPEIPDLAPPIDDKPLSFSYHAAWGFAGVLFGVAMLMAVAFMEHLSLRDASGTHIAIVAEGEPLWDGTIPIGVRRVPMSEFPTINEAIESFRNSATSTQEAEIEKMIEDSSIERTETVICIDLNPDILESILESGRLPKQGASEVLAGVYTRLDTFTIDDQPFEVVGRIRTSAAGLYFSYLLPRDDSTEQIFFESSEATRGWFDFDAQSEIEAIEDPDEVLTDADVLYGQMPTRSGYTLLSILALAIVAFFGMLAHLSVFRVLHATRCGPLRPAFRVFLQHPKTVLSMHLLLFGTFFGMMLIGYREPVIQMWMNSMIRAAFEDGEISYVMDAYNSGNVLLAAWATFWNNYVVQTVLLTVCISLILPMIGILKTMLSFSAVGFGMVPSMTGMAGIYTFHSITLTLELEAYVFACVCVAYFWACFAKGIAVKEFVPYLKRGSIALASGTLLAGIMLAFAGFYEAVTLILARG